MKIGIIGAGKVGFSLGRFLAQGGVSISGYCSRSIQSAQEAAAFVGTRAFSTVEELIRQSDAIFITVPDKAITAVYRQLTAFEIQDKFICHCSGAMSAQEAFPGIRETGAHGASIHPLFPISSKTASWRELSDAFFCLEGDQPAVDAMGAVLRLRGCHVQEIAPEEKVRYHAACVMASNFVCALAQESVDLLTGCGFTPEGALTALTPLMRSNLTHLAESGPIAALTGPVERCDTETVKKHLEQLPSEEEKELYRLMSRKLVQMAARKRPNTVYEPMETLLNEERNES